MAENSLGSVALVTGVSRAEGIGFAVCRQLAMQSKTVFLTARTLEKAGLLASALKAEGLPVRPLSLDVTYEDSVRTAAKMVEDQFDRLDILVNNAAGIAPFGEQALNADLTTAHAVMETTLFGAWRMCQIFLPLLRKSKAGKIVNVTSGAGSHGDQQFGLASGNAMGTSYAVSKAALNALTVKIANELRGDGILVNAVDPGFTATFPGAEQMGARPVAEGAASVVWAATLDSYGPTGGFFRNGKPLPW